MAVDSRVRGDDLGQALAELVKNSYDADGDWAIVRIDTAGRLEDHPDDVGYVEIEDNGVGMDLDTIERGWLTIDRSQDPTLLGLLFQMNDTQNVTRSLGLSNANVMVSSVSTADRTGPQSLCTVRGSSSVFVQVTLP